MKELNVGYFEVDGVKFRYGLYVKDNGTSSLLVSQTII